MPRDTGHDALVAGVRNRDTREMASPYRPGATLTWGVSDRPGQNAAGSAWGLPKDPAEQDRVLHPGAATPLSRVGSVSCSQRLRRTGSAVDDATRGQRNWLNGDHADGDHHARVHIRSIRCDSATRAGTRADDNALAEQRPCRVNDEKETAQATDPVTIHFSVHPYLEHRCLRVMTSDRECDIRA